MGIIKRMYQDADDETKQKIANAWQDSQNTSMRTDEIDIWNSKEWEIMCHQFAIVDLLLISKYIYCSDYAELLYK